MQFVKVPRELIYASTVSEKRASCFSYLIFNSTLQDTVAYSAKQIITWCGFKPNWNRSKTKANIYDKFLDCMTWIYQNGYILNFEDTEFTGNNYCYSLLNTDKMFPSDNFGIIYDFEIEKIKNYKSKYRTLTQSTILLILSYIRVNLWKRSANLEFQEEKLKKEKPEICNKQILEISNDIGISERLISRSIDILVELDIIDMSPMPRFQDELGNWHTEDSIFVNKYKFIRNEHGVIIKDNSYDYESELSNGIDFIRKRKYVSRKFYQK